MKHTNINTFIVQAIQFLPILVLLFEMLDPAPALAFSNQVTGPDLIFIQTVSNISDLGTRIPLKKGLLLRITASAYTSSSELTDSSPYTTASGTRTRYGIIATNILPMFTKVKIGSEVFTVEDRMNSRYDQSLFLDIWLPTEQAAINFGVRTIDAQIVALPGNN
ncbi:MAG TPA: hypothetical protein VLG69_00515 [Candidatus Andersenbacteria bacterium]|nr:hypothetical protein [Candidatus Andersenbacteria bacterium]